MSHRVGLSDQVILVGQDGLIHLSADSTTTDFVIRFLDKVILGASVRSTATLTATAEGVVAHSDDHEH
jgi:hypothetical protein